MNSSLWVIIALVTGIVGFLLGYSVSSYTGARAAAGIAAHGAPPAAADAGPAQPGGHGGAEEQAKPAASGYGGAGEQAKPAAGGYGAPEPAAKPAPKASAPQAPTKAAVGLLAATFISGLRIRVRARP